MRFAIAKLLHQATNADDPPQAIEDLIASLEKGEPVEGAPTPADLVNALQAEAQLSAATAVMVVRVLRKLGIV